MPIGRSGIGRWLGLGGVPELNEAAGAKLDGYDDDGKPIYKNSEGKDVSESAAKYGTTTAVKQPSWATRVFNPVLAERSDLVNTQYRTNPVMSAQDYGIQKGQAKDVIRSALALQQDKRPSEISDDEVEKIYGATGTSAKTGGLSPQHLNDIHQAIVEGKLGVPETKGHTAAIDAETGLEKSSAFQQAGGGFAAGRSAASIVKVSGEKAESESRLLPGSEAAQKAEDRYRSLLSGSLERTLPSGEERRDTENMLAAKQARGAMNRMPTTEALLDQNATNALAEAHDVTPNQVKRAAIEASGALGRAPSQEEVHSHLLSAELTKARSLDESKDLLGQTVKNQARQQLVESTQPPGVLTGSPALYNPNPKFQAGDNIIKAYRKMPGVNPMFMPSTMGKVIGGEKMQEYLEGKGQPITLPNGEVLDPNEMSGGGGSALGGNAKVAPGSQAPSAAATTAIAQPTVATPSMAGRHFLGTNNGASIVATQPGAQNDPVSRIQYLMNQKKTFGLLTDKEREELEGYFQ